jgi:hypothetical protein
MASTLLGVNTTIKISSNSGIITGQSGALGATTGFNTVMYTVPANSYAIVCGADVTINSGGFAADLAVRIEQVSTYSENIVTSSTPVGNFAVHSFDFSIAGVQTVLNQVKMGPGAVIRFLGTSGVAGGNATATVNIIEFTNSP